MEQMMTQNEFDGLGTVRTIAVSCLKAQSEANKCKALASLKLLLDHPAGIGDHSTTDYHKNLDEALGQLVDAEDRLNTLDKYFPS